MLSPTYRCKCYQIQHPILFFPRWRLSPSQNKVFHKFFQMKSENLFKIPPEGWSNVTRNFSFKHIWTQPPILIQKVAELIFWRRPQTISHSNSFFQWASFSCSTLTTKLKTVRYSILHQNVCSPVSCTGIPTFTHKTCLWSVSELTVFQLPWGKNSKALSETAHLARSSEDHRIQRKCRLMCGFSVLQRCLPGQLFYCYGVISKCDSLSPGCFHRLFATQLMLSSVKRSFKFSPILLDFLLPNNN